MWVSENFSVAKYKDDIKDWLDHFLTTADKITQSDFYFQAKINRTNA